MDSYQVISSAAQRQEFKALCKQAQTEGRLLAATKSAEEIISRLQEDPNSAGELLYQLKQWQLPVRHFAHAPWPVHFAVDDARYLVYIKHIALLDDKK